MPKVFQFGKKKVASPTQPLKKTVPKQTTTLPQPVEAPKRGRGRPRKTLVSLDHGVQQPRVVERVTRMAQAPTQKKFVPPPATLTQNSSRPRGAGGDATPKAIIYLTGLLARTAVQEYRGKQVKPTVYVSPQEMRMLQDALALFALKVQIEQIGQRKRSRVRA